MARDPNEPSGWDHNAPYNEDDEGNCDCHNCRGRRIREAKNKYYEENGPDDYDDRQARYERMVDYADFRRKEIKEDAMIRSMKKEEGI
jgi:hypothetical protein